MFCESSELTVSGRGIEENMLLKCEIPVTTNLTASGFIVSSNRMLRDTESEGGVR